MYQHVPSTNLLKLSCCTKPEGKKDQNRTKTTGISTSHPMALNELSAEYGSQQHN